MAARIIHLARFYSGLAALLALLIMPAAAAALSEYAFLSAEVLQHNQRVIAQEKLRGAGPIPLETQQAYRQLLQQADKALKRPNPSVMDKSSIPPSGSKHDYLSLSAYWWPDSQKSDGLPWIRQDGQINPASKNEESDGVRLADFTDQVQTLTLAWYFSGEQKYADKAISLIKTWFIDPDTRMNPNLNFAQGVPGIAAGRGTGVLDGRYFATRIVDSLIMLRQNERWTAQDEKQIRQWMTAYLQWLRHSPAGQKEAAAKNNHGNWYTVQVAGIAWYLQQPQVVVEMAELLKTKLDTQLAADGSQPLELARTRSFHYSYFSLQAAILMAQLADKVKIDLWHYQTPDGSGLIKALDFMAPFSSENNQWPSPSLDKFGIRLVPLMAQADKALGENRYQQWIQQANFSDAGAKVEKKRRGAVAEALRDIGLFSIPINK
ncbi:alginate lyase family protein [Yersinia hibernica]|uniref:Alginate lyase n=1 Tax=Yersinia enterocolitica LC20 TaxID=1443113 RepID=A0A7U4K0S6_YEREN|nr:alginate lyase family protein [Yersinia hibernica]AHM73123.2 alginate lyase [Yersinia hibernica]OVZ84539.1 alginate lyase [Yersinia kristensenii]